MRRYVLGLIISIQLLAGCERSYKTTADSNDIAVEPGVNGLIAYLTDRNIDTLNSVEPWPNEYADGLALLTPHYEIRTTLLEPLILRQLPDFVEAAFAAYNAQLPRPVESNRRSLIYLFADRTQWEDFTHGFTGKQARLFCAIEAGAYCHNGTCVAYNIGRSRTFSALAHEGWHQFSSRHFTYRLPSWLDEGVAMLFESVRLEQGRFRFAPESNDYRLDSLRTTLARRRMLPLDELLATNPGEVLATDRSESVRSLYSQWYALVRFLREGSGGSRLDSYRRMLADGADGAWPIDRVTRNIARDRNQPRTVLWNRIIGIILFRRYIAADIGRIQREYLAFCRHAVLQAPAGR